MLHIEGDTQDADGQQSVLDYGDQALGLNAGYDGAQHPLSDVAAHHRTKREGNGNLKGNLYLGQHLLSNGNSGHGEDRDGGQDTDGLHIEVVHHIHQRIDDNYASHPREGAHCGSADGDQKI